MILIRAAPPLRATRALNSTLLLAIKTIPELRTSMVSQRCSRCFSTTKIDAQSGQRYEAVVVGAGPAGVAVVGNLLEQKKAPILWVDNLFEGGRLNRYYREVPRCEISPDS